MSILAGRTGAIKFLALFGALNFGFTYLSKVYGCYKVGDAKIGDDNSGLHWLSNRLKNPVHDNGGNKT